MGRLVGSAQHSDVSFLIQRIYSASGKPVGTSEPKGSVQSDQSADQSVSCPRSPPAAAPRPKRIYAHRALLYRYPFFNGLLTGPFAEGNNNQDIELGGEDLTEATFLNILRWSYTGDRSIVDENSVVELLVASSRFGIEDLQLVCETFISDRLDADNAEGCLHIAGRYRHTVIRGGVMGGELRWVDGVG